MNISVLGAGAYGSALGGVLKRNGHRVRFYDPYKFPERSLIEALGGAEAIVLAVPAASVNEILGQIPEKFAFMPLIVATKGVLALKVYTRKFFYVEILSGPGFASEILGGKRIKLTVGAVGGESLTEKIFFGDQIKFDKTEDREGVLLLGGLKNIYAIGAGARGLKIGTGEFKQYIQQTIREAEKFLILNGGFLETARLSAGLGDFVLTCGSEESRNYMFGKNGYKKRGRETVEGLFAAKEIRRRRLKIPAEAEILRGVLSEI